MRGVRGARSAGATEWRGENLVRHLTSVAVVQPDTMSVVLAVALHGVVAEVALGHFHVGVDHHLSRRDKKQRELLHTSTKNDKENQR